MSGFSRYLDVIEPIDGSRFQMPEGGSRLEFSRGETASGQFTELVAGPRDDDFEQILFDLHLIAETQRMRELREVLENQEKLTPQLVGK